MRIRKKSSKKPFIIALIAAVVLIGGGVWAYSYFSNDSENNNTRNVNEINYDPPTEQEQKAGDEQKEQLTKDEQTPQTNDVQVAIVDANQYDDTVEIRAFVQGIIEGGTCTATLTKNGQTVTKKTDAFIDATTTQCGNLNIPRSEFPSAGEWSLKVSYSSESHAGTSEEWKVTIE